jgi:hypothetical protein
MSNTTDSGVLSPVETKFAVVRFPSLSNFAKVFAVNPVTYRFPAASKADPVVNPLAPMFRVSMKFPALS